MKKFAILFLAFILLFAMLLAGCDESAADDNTSEISVSSDAILAGDLDNGSRWFIAKVLEVSSSNIRVMPLGDGFEAKQALDSGIIVHSEIEASINDYVRITYSGAIAESYPPQIFSVTSVELIDPDSFTDNNDVYFTVQNLFLSGNYPSIEVIWHNDSDSIIEYGEWYTIEYLKDGEWVDTAIGELSYDDIAYTLSAGSTAFRSYAIGYSFNIETPGTYRLRTRYLYPGGQTSEKHNITVEFEVVSE